MTEVSSWDDFGIPWGDPDDPALKVELPDIHVSMSSSGMEELQQYHKKNKTLSAIMGTAVLILVLGFIAGMVTTCATDNGTGACVGILIVIVTAIILAICSSINSKNSKMATELFKNRFVRRELSPYVERLQLQDAEYVYKKASISHSAGDDLSGPMPPEYVVRALGLGNNQCNKNHVQEWMSGVYHGTPFRFFEVKLIHEYYTGAGKSQQHHEDIVYNGQGYIFKTKVRMPFPIQYVYNHEVEEITIENFDNVFKSFRASPSFEAKEKLTEEERKVFNTIEAREFKVCLLKLAKIFGPQMSIYKKILEEHPEFKEMMKEHSTIYSIFGDRKLTVRLMNENIVILREGPYDYFEINLDNALNEEFDKFSRELSEFVSVLETMGALSLVSGGEESDSF